MFKDTRLRDNILPVRVVASERAENVQALLQAECDQIGLLENSVATVHGG